MSQIETETPDQRTPREIFKEAIFKVVTREHRPGSFPIGAVTQMGTLLKPEVSTGELAAKWGKSERRVRHIVNSINKEYLEEFGIKIVGERVYALRKTDKSDQRSSRSILSDVISAIVSKDRRYGSPAPEKLVKYLGAFSETRIPIGILAERLEMSKRGASRVVNNLNRVYLKDSGVKIEGDYFYRLEKIKK